MYHQSTHPYQSTATRHIGAHWLLLAAVLLPFVASPARAQEQQPEHVLLDVTLFVSPPDRPGLCMPLGAGQVTITVQRTSEAIERRRTDFSFAGYQDDPQMNVAIPVSNSPVTVTAHAAGSYHYCWSIDVYAPETERMSGAARGAYVQRISVKIVHRPD